MSFACLLPTIHRSPLPTLLCLARRTAANGGLRRYHLKDVIVGKIYFLLVRIKIKHMELSIIRRETTGSPPNQYNESETITKFEIMDGAPVRGASVAPSSIMAFIRATAYRVC